uniref:hypothetical protein n=1 Tax=Butyrivibrio sp. AE2005 TaxID=1496722 RepID=UPI000558AFAB
RIIFILAIFVHQPEAEGNYFAVRLVLADDVYRFLMLMMGVPRGDLFGGLLRLVYRLVIR